MKNYYAEFLEKEKVNTLGSDVAKVAKGQNIPSKGASATFATALPGINPKKSFSEDSAANRLNRMIAAGVSFEVSAADFQAFGASERENVFLRDNKAAILCTLQQMFLTKHLFNHSPELLEAFQTEVHERSAIMSDGGGEIIFQALAAVCAEWITEAIKNENK